MDSGGKSQLRPLLRLQVYQRTMWVRAPTELCEKNSQHIHDYNHELLNAVAVSIANRCTQSLVNVSSCCTYPLHKVCANLVNPFCILKILELHD